MAGHTDNSISIAAPADLTWAVANDLDRWPELFAGEYARVDLLDADGERLVYRVAREGLLNSVRHSEAGSIRITLLSDKDNAAILEIADDGKGFDVRSTLRHAPTGHFGLAVMADTVGAAGAELKYRSAPGAGTTIRLRVPR